MKQKRSCLLLVFIPLCILMTFTILGGLVGFNWLMFIPRSQPKPANQALFQGITYAREVRNSSRPMVAHVVTVNLRAPGISLLVTPGDPKAERPLKARTTSKFLDQFGVQIAINGDGFTPWYSNNILDYYPRSGDAVEPIGFAASEGKVYSDNLHEQPVLYFTRNNQARFGTPPGKIINAISGNLMLVQDGKVLPSLEGTREPRTAIGLDKRGRSLIIVVVDGRQPGYSEGATLEELASILVAHGAHTAMNLDGGGSSTLVIEQGGKATLLNSPINHGIPGWERPVGNHLGVFAEQSK